MSDSAPPMPTRRGPAWLAGTVGAIVVGLLLVFALIGGMLWSVRPTPNVSSDPDAKPPAELLAELRAAESAKLSTYGWVDRDSGVVRIPLAAATEKFLAESAAAASED